MPRILAEPDDDARVLNEAIGVEKQAADGAEPSSERKLASCSSQSGVRTTVSLLRNVRTSPELCRAASLLKAAKLKGPDGAQTHPAIFARDPKSTALWPGACHCR